MPWLLRRLRFRSFRNLLDGLPSPFVHSSEVYSFCYSFSSKTFAVVFRFWISMFAPSFGTFLDPIPPILRTQLYFFCSTCFVFALTHSDSLIGFRGLKPNKEILLYSYLRLRSDSDPDPSLIPSHSFYVCYFYSDGFYSSDGSDGSDSGACT